MSTKDLIIRVSGTNEDAEAFFKQVIDEGRSIGLLPDNPSVRALPEKIKKKDLKNNKAKDVQFTVLGKEKSVEDFLEAVVDSIAEETNLKSSSINIKLESQNEKKQVK